MNIQTISLVTPPGCDGHCPYCVSRMTGLCKVDNLDLMDPTNNQNGRWTMKLSKVLRLGIIHGASTVIITGKGEPMLFPTWIEAFMRHLDGGWWNQQQFPFIELQTNALRLGKDFKSPLWDWLKNWHTRGATHVAISVVSLDRDENQQIYDPKGEYIDLSNVIDKLQHIGYTIRLNCIMVRGYIDHAAAVMQFVEHARLLGIDQVSFRPVNCPDRSENEEVWKWTKERTLLPDELDHIRNVIATQGTRLLRLPHGAVIYDVEGQNVCLTDCLSTDEAPDNLRQIIFMPDGSLTYSWQHTGAILLR